jgi:hypothetical protein
VAVSGDKPTVPYSLTIGPKTPHHPGNIVLLEEANTSDSGSSGCQTGVRVSQCDPAQRQNRDVRLASLAEKFEACAKGAFLFEDGTEDGEGCGVGGGLGYFCDGVTGDRDDWILWRELAGRTCPECVEGSARRPTLARSTFGPCRSYI